MNKSKDYDRESFFPFSLVEEVIFILKEKNCSFVTYADYNLDLIHPKLDNLSYFLEFLNFNIGHYSKLKQINILTKFLFYRVLYGQRLSVFLSKKNNRVGPTVVLQHDADQQPYKTVDMMKLEKKLNVCSSSYFFRNQNFDIQHTYTLDIEELQNLENIGFEIGYHLNAYELAEYDDEKVTEIINNDLEYFRSKFHLRTFVPHGGYPSLSGKNNDNIPYRGKLRNYSWCYNGRGFFQNEMWSDGNIYFENIEDPRVVASRLKKGQRGMFLMHPQYYGNELSRRYHELPVSKERWWRKLWNL